MRKLLNPFAVTLIAALAVHSEAALLITEVGYNVAGTDADGEWVEIYNNGTSVIDLTNYKIGDEETSGATSTTEATYQFPSGASIAPGEVQIVALKATGFNTLYGFLPTYETSADTDPTVPNMSVYLGWDDGGTITIANDTDQVLILDPSDLVVDGVSWDHSAPFNPYFLDQPLPSNEADGQSIERINALVDRDLAADWRLGNPSSPGSVSIPEPATVFLALLAAFSLPVRRS